MKTPSKPAPASTTPAAAPVSVPAPAIATDVAARDKIIAALEQKLAALATAKKQKDVEVAAAIAGIPVREAAIAALEQKVAVLEKAVTPLPVVGTSWTSVHAAAAEAEIAVVRLRAMHLNTALHAALEVINMCNTSTCPREVLDRLKAAQAAVA